MMKILLFWSRCFLWEWAQYGRGKYFRIIQNEIGVNWVCVFNMLWLIRDITMNLNCYASFDKTFVEIKYFHSSRVPCFHTYTSHFVLFLVRLYVDRTQEGVLDFCIALIKDKSFKLIFLTTHQAILNLIWGFTLTLTLTLIHFFVPIEKQCLQRQSFWDVSIKPV